MVYCRTLGYEATGTETGTPLAKDETLVSQTPARIYAQSYVVAIALAKKSYVSSVVASVRSHQVGPFYVVQRILQSGTMVVVACCEWFTSYFAGKIHCIHSELDAGLNV